MAAGKDSILLIEDSRALAEVYERTLIRAGYPVVVATTAAEAKSLFSGRFFRLALVDLMLPDGDGLDLIAEFRAAREDAKLLVVTANGSVNRAVEAMRRGADDFLMKPLDGRRLVEAVQGALAAAGPAVHREEDARTGLVGSSAVMRRLQETLRSVARSSAKVFITGESGTGKELCAEAIHAYSGRAARPFVAINCAAIPRDLLESEVFGYRKGAFTGAVTDKIGAAQSADGGTLFLDEICEMDLALQAKMLRFLESGMVQPLGASEPKKVDVRIVCATNRNPREEVRAGRFREDLFYRLHVVPIALPPLRDRNGDVLEIAEALLAQISAEEGRSFTDFNEDARRMMLNYPWPGNVRELQNLLRKTILLFDGPTVTAEMLEPSLGPAEAAVDPAPLQAPVQAGTGASLAAALGPFVGQPLARLERAFITATIAACDGSVPHAARLLDVSPSTIYRKREAWVREDASLKGET